MAHSPTPTSSIRVARLGGTVAELAAAAISAHTLYHLGGQLDLGSAAWLLPVALDAYAFTALAVGYSLPADHPGQRPVLRNARLAFAISLGCNALDHFLRKAGQLIDSTTRDLLLVAVATLPSLVVERLLNLQSRLVGHGAEQPAAADESAGDTTDRQEAAVGEVDLAHAGAAAGLADRARKARPDWLVIGSQAFPELTSSLGRRPSGREFQAALAAHAKVLAAAGALPAGTKAPSVTSAKRIRAMLESAETPTSAASSSVRPSDDLT
ncbi:hypothetical protein ABH935_005404 [Catenulispora sp. GAS73]|uniref:hypothetical protein n=1 Tax=Catenulispora sp. GAS73 TaxID=3156269 RepID=UPI0035137405